MYACRLCRSLSKAKKLEAYSNTNVNYTEITTCLVVYESIYDYNSDNDGNGNNKLIMTTKMIIDDDDNDGDDDEDLTMICR